MRDFLLLPIFVLSAFLLYSCGTESTPTYTLSTSVVGEGTITPTGRTFEEGETVTLTGTPSNGWLFEKWEGDWSSSDNPSTITMNTNKQISGVFLRRNYPLTITIEGEGTVGERILSQLKTIDYPFETVVELTPNPSEGWRFIEWSGDLSGDEVPETITITDNKSVNVRFGSLVKIFSGSNNDQGYDLIQTEDGGFVLTGFTSSNDGDFSGLNHGSSDIFVIKLDPYGNINWVKIFGGLEDEQGLSIVSTEDDGLILTGWSESNDGDFSGMKKGTSYTVVIKLSSLGNTEWIKTFGGSGQDIPSSITKSVNGGYVLTGRSNSRDGDFIGMNKGHEFIFVIKLDPEGNTQWIKTYGGSGFDRGNSIVSTEDGGYVVTGSTFSNDGDFNKRENGNIFVMKLDFNGEIEWNHFYGGSNSDDGIDIKNTTDGGFIITGRSKSNDFDFDGLNNGDWDIILLKLDSSGNKEWVKTYGGLNLEEGSSVFQTNDNGFVLTGWTRSPDGDFEGLKNSDRFEVFVIKLNDMGEVDWSRVLNGNFMDFGTSIIESIDGNILFTGYTNSSQGYFSGSGLNSGRTGVFLVKLNSNGELIPFN